MSTEIQPATNTPPATTVVPTAATPPSWTQGFNEDLKGFVSTKGFQSADAVVDAYRNLEKMIGAPPERILKLTDKMRGDDGMLTAEGRAIFERLGAPKDAKDYQIEVPKEYGDANMAESFRKLFHDEGINKSSAEKIVKSWNEYQANAMKTAKEQSELAFKNADQNLRKEWGQAYDQNLNIAKEAVRTLGIGEKEINAMSQALGHDKAMQFFQKMGSSVGEGKFVKGGNPSSVMEPGQAQYQIKELMKDRDFGARLSKGDAEATGRWNRLHEMAYPGEFKPRS